MIQQESHTTPLGRRHTITTNEGAFASAFFEVAGMAGHEIEAEVLADGRTHVLVFLCADDDEVARLYSAAYILEEVFEAQVLAKAGR